MDNFLSVNQVTGLLNLVQSGPQVIVPRVQLFVSELLALVDCYDACQSVNLSSDTPVDHHVAKLILGALDRDTDQLTHAGQADAAVVLLDHSQVVLHQLPYQLDQVVLVVQSAVLERLKGGHLLGDIVLLERHQLKGKELAHVLGQKLLSLELTRVHRLHKVEQVDFVLSIR